MKIRYLNRKDAIRAELLNCAKQGETPFYSEFGNRVGIPAQGPWKPVLDVISREETENGRPDITFVLLNKGTGFPGQIGFDRANPPTAEQKDLARRELQKVFDKYCPLAKIPF